MKKLSIDIETYSTVDLRKTGVYPYAKSEDIENCPMFFAYQFPPYDSFSKFDYDTAFRLTVQEQFSPRIVDNN